MHGSTWRHPATWLALLALLLAASGSAYAATKVSGKSIKKHSIPGNRLKPGAVSGAEVADGSLSGSDLAPGSLLQPGKVALSDLTPAARAALAETVPAGALVVGPARLVAQAISGTDTYFVPSGTIDYGGRRMPTAMVPEFVGVGHGPTAHCKGSVAAPDADPGYLCLYLSFVQGGFALAAYAPEVTANNGRNYVIGSDSTISSGAGNVGRLGAVLSLSPAPLNVHDVWLVWAARAAA
jgi:hypothetical protein